MRKISLIMAASCFAFAANAGEIAPSDVAYSDGAVEMALTDTAGDPVNGRKVFMNRKLGNCLACHVNSEIPEQPFHGEVGPEMNGVADRWEVSELRGIVANSKMMFEDTIMPSFYNVSGYNRTLEKFDGKSILSAQQVEDVVAYLQTLKEE